LILPAAANADRQTWELKANRDGAPEYIVRLVGQEVTVSMETVKLVSELAALSIDQV
jgi:hypothetical protein